MSRKLFILALMLALIPLTARAQLFDPEHRLAIEVLAGTSPVQTMLEKYKEDLPDGTTYVNKMGPAVTLSAVYELNDKWFIQGGLNLSRAIFDISSAEDPYPYTEYGTPTLTFLFSARYNWLRKEHVKVFSGVGFGMTPKVMMAVFFPTPIPSITPIGATVGFDTLYFTAEITAGSNSLGGLAGIGFRF
jgi:hypothetical protein